ncbi:HNH endonuclease [Streptomyces hygroscopicus]|uniref:HNH endonuclease n=1 Tax=Streptomyces hygroscopicus TaxID=1912 RepID=UPI003822DE6B
MTKSIRPKSINCARCGTQRTVGSGGAVPTHCHKCRHTINRERARADGRYEKRLAAERQRTKERQVALAKPCPYCAEPVLNPARKQCGKPECTKQAKAERMRDYMRTYRATDGGGCRRREQEYAKAYREANGHWRKRYPEAAALSDARRRALIEAALKAERFAPRDVYERDKWTCGLCRRPVDPGLAWPHPMSASVDHILPLSQGGSHTLANVQCAHLSCNSSKGDRTIEEVNEIDSIIAAIADAG